MLQYLVLPSSMSSSFDSNWRLLGASYHSSSSLWSQCSCAINLGVWLSLMALAYARGPSPHDGWFFFCCLHDRDIAVAVLVNSWLLCLKILFPFFCSLFLLDFRTLQYTMSLTSFHVTGPPYYPVVHSFPLTNTFNTTVVILDARFPPEVKGLLSVSVRTTLVLFLACFCSWCGVWHFALVMSLANKAVLDWTARLYQVQSSLLVLDGVYTVWDLGALPVGATFLLVSLGTCMCRSRTLFILGIVLLFFLSAVEWF